MALNIKNPEVERLVGDVAARTGESKTEAIRRALEERLARLEAESSRRERVARFWRYLETDVWPNLPRGERGRTMTREEEDAILGYGPHGV
jgi:antitoxin VapB